MIFLGRKILASIFLGSFSKVGIFLGYSRFMIVHVSPWLHRFSGNFCGSEIRHEIFLGLHFGPGIFLVLFEALEIFLGFDFCSHLIVPVTWNLEYPPPRVSHAHSRLVSSY